MTPGLAWAEISNEIPCQVSSHFFAGLRNDICHHIRVIIASSYLLHLLLLLHIIITFAITLSHIFLLLIFEDKSLTESTIEFRKWVKGPSCCPFFQNIQ